MTTRTCACGATIVRVDLDGWDIWLDQEPARDGMYTVTAGQAIIASDGTHRRHVCGHAPDPVEDASPASQEQLWVLAEKRADIARRCAARNIAAAQALIAAGAKLAPLERQVAALRIEHPDLTSGELARLAGHRPGTFGTAFFRLRKAAEQLTTTTNHIGAQAA